MPGVGTPSPPSTRDSPPTFSSASVQPSPNLRACTPPAHHTLATLCSLVLTTSGAAPCLWLPRLLVDRLEPHWPPHPGPPLLLPLIGLHASPEVKWPRSTPPVPRCSGGFLIPLPLSWVSGSLTLGLVLPILQPQVETSSHAGVLQWLFAKPRKGRIQVRAGFGFICLKEMASRSLCVSIC